MHWNHDTVMSPEMSPHIPQSVQLQCHDAGVTTHINGGPSVEGTKLCIDI